MMISIRSAAKLFTPNISSISASLASFRASVTPCSDELWPKLTQSTRSHCMMHWKPRLETTPISSDNATCCSFPSLKSPSKAREKNFDCLQRSPFSRLYLVKPIVITTYELWKRGRVLQLINKQSFLIEGQLTYNDANSSTGTVWIVLLLSSIAILRNQGSWLLIKNISRLVRVKSWWS